MKYDVSSHPLSLYKDKRFHELAFDLDSQIIAPCSQLPAPSLLIAQCSLSHRVKVR